MRDKSTRMLSENGVESITSFEYISVGPAKAESTDESTGIIKS